VNAKKAITNIILKTLIAKVFVDLIYYLYEKNLDKDWLKSEEGKPYAPLHVNEKLTIISSGGATRIDITQNNRK
jgi:hypothetical protein